MTPFELIRSRFAGEARKVSSGYDIRCPIHDDQKASLNFKEADDGRVLLHCRAGCSTEDILAAWGLKMRDLFPEREDKGNGGSGATIRWEIRNPDGKTVAVHVRRGNGKDKRMHWELPDGTVGFKKKMKVGDLPLYAIDRLGANGPNGSVVVTEGEKAADALLAYGIPAVGTVTGAAKIPRDEVLQPLLSTKVYLWPDNDEPGQKHMNEIGAALLRMGHRNVWMLVWKDAPERGDAADLMEREAAMDEFYVMQEEAQRIEPDDLPIINVDEGSLPVQSEAIWNAIKRANGANPFLFRRGGRPVRVGVNDDGKPCFEELTDIRMRHEVSRITRCVKTRRDGTVVAGRLTLDVVKDALALPAGKMPLPVVWRIVGVPMCDRDGNVCDRPGYNPDARILYIKEPGLDIPPIPTHPTPDDLAEAVRLLNEPFREFPWKGPADLTHTIAFGLLPFCREMIKGPTPLHCFGAPVPGTGKTKAAYAAAWAAGGGNVGVVTATNEEEIRKKITTELDRGVPVVIFDNLEKMDSANLSAALTSNTWTDRRMRTQEAITVPNRAVWALTGNNVTFSLEIARRAVAIRMNPECERPWTREGFTHPDLIGWVDEHRGLMVWANLVLIRSWVAAGKPPYTKRTLGSFEEWTRVIGGILEQAGFCGFLENMDDLYENLNIEGPAWREFVRSWWDTFQSRAVAVADLYPLAEAIDTFPLGNGKEERSRRTYLGMALGKKRDCVIGGYLIRAAGKDHRIARWRLIAVEDQQQQNLFEKEEDDGQ